MKSQLLFFLLLLFVAIPLRAQPEADIEYSFEPLEIHAHITSKKTIAAIKEKDVIKNSPFFFTQKYGNEKGLFLIEKTAKDWIVYDYNFFVSNYSIKKPKALSKRYVSISVGAMRSGMGENWYGWFMLFDLKKRSALYFMDYSHNSGKYDNGDTFLQECSSTVKYSNGSLKVSRKCKVKKEDANYCRECMKPGTYKILEDKLKISGGK